MFSVTEFASVKGGQGCTTTAAAYAVLHSQAGVRVLLLGNNDDVFAVLGVSVQADAIVEVSPTLDVACAADEPPVDRLPKYDEVVADVGDTGSIAAAVKHYVPTLQTRRLLVTKACYLALRDAVALADDLDGVVLVEEAGRALSASDIAGATGVAVVATVPYQPTVSRCVDAGLLAARVPALLSSALRPLFD